MCSRTHGIRVIQNLFSLATKDEHQLKLQCDKELKLLIMVMVRSLEVCKVQGKKASL